MPMHLAVSSAWFGLYSSEGYMRRGCGIFLQGSREPMRPLVWQEGPYMEETVFLLDGLAAVS